MIEIKFLISVAPPPWFQFPTPISIVKHCTQCGRWTTEPVKKKVDCNYQGLQKRLIVSVSTYKKSTVTVFNFKVVFNTESKSVPMFKVCHSKLFWTNTNGPRTLCVRGAIIIGFYDKESVRYNVIFKNHHNFSRGHLVFYDKKIWHVYMTCNF